MAYFPHAFQKMLVGTAGFNTTPGTTLTLTAGQIGVVRASDHQIQNLGGTPTYTGSSGNPLFYLAQGSFHTTDKIGPFHGGYKETVKSKGINPKYVSAFYVTEPAAPVNEVLGVSVLNCTSIACNTTYRLRLDVKGSPALRFLTHNLYQTLDAKTPCCDSSNNNADPVGVLLQWKDQINESPIMKEFVNAKVFNFKVGGFAAAATTNSTTLTIDTTSGSGGTTPAGLAAGQMITGTGIPQNTFITGVSGGTLTLSKAATVAGDTVALKVYEEVLTSSYTLETGASLPDTNDAMLVLTGAYVDTTFGNCSFSPMDHYELEPIQIYAAVVDTEGDPCQTSCFTVTELQTAYQGKGFGETLIRELILSKRYAQEPFQTDPRMREVLDDTTLSDLSRSTRYFAYHILHSVPRTSNPSGTMDADQYLVKIVVSARSTPFETYMNALLTSAGNHVQLAVQL
jgi:hypothetical protein